MFVYFQNIHSHQLINTKRTGTTDIFRLALHAQGLADGQVLGGRCDIGPLEHRHCGCPAAPTRPQVSTGSLVPTGLASWGLLKGVLQEWTQE